MIPMQRSAPAAATRYKQMLPTQRLPAASITPFKPILLLQRLAADLSISSNPTHTTPQFPADILTSWRHRMVSPADRKHRHCTPVPSFGPIQNLHLFPQPQPTN